jgi:N-acetyltransferase
VWRTPRLDGDLVRLEPLGPHHLGALWDASQYPEVWRWLPIHQPRDREALHAWLEEALSGPYLPFATVRVETGHAIGSTRFMAMRPEHGSLEIGWTWLARPEWSTGANVEAKLLQMTHAFEAWGCRRVELKTDALNARSRGAMEAFGARFEGIHRKHMLVRGGENRDSAWYSVVDDDWPVVKAGLLARLERLDETTGRTGGVGIARPDEERGPAGA